MQARLSTNVIHDQINDANFPKDSQGRTYHVGTKEGEVSNLIITGNEPSNIVGDPARAKKIAENLESSQCFSSKRGFLTITGIYKGKLISIISIGMGYSMIDMMVREVRAVTMGPLYIIRLGSCGGLGKDTKIGSISVLETGVLVSH